MCWLCGLQQSRKPTNLAATRWQVICNGVLDDFQETIGAVLGANAELVQQLHYHQSLKMETQHGIE